MGFQLDLRVLSHYRSYYNPSWLPIHLKPQMPNFSHLRHRGSQNVGQSLEAEKGFERLVNKDIQRKINVALMPRGSGAKKCFINSYIGMLFAPNHLCHGPLPNYSPHFHEIVSAVGKILLNITQT